MPTIRPRLRREIGSAVNIRDAKSSDFIGISRCYWADPETPWDLYSNARLLKRLVGPKGFLVAEVQRRIVGFVHYRMFRKRPWFDPQVWRYGQILELHVKDSFQRRGIGRRLMVETITRLEAEGCRVIYTHSDEMNTQALKLYGSLGFTSFLRTFYLKRDNRGLPSQATN